MARNTRHTSGRHSTVPLLIYVTVDAANHMPGDRHRMIGPSHFVKKEQLLDDGRVRFLWEQPVLPYIEKRYFDNEVQLKDLSYHRLMPGISGSATATGADDPPPQDTPAAGDGQANDDGDDAAS